MVTKLQEEITSYQEIITIKDNVVMGLTYKLEELQKHGQLPEQHNQQDQGHIQKQDQLDHQDHDQSLPDQQESHQGQDQGDEANQLNQEDGVETHQQQLTENQIPLVTSR